MQTIEFQTSYGVIPVSGVFGDRLKILAITGAWASPDEMSRLAIVVGPEFDGVVATLPGNRSPPLSEASIVAWARAFDEVVDQLGPTLVMGLSMGGLVALGMRAPLGIVAVEPPLMTGKLWPMMGLLQEASAHEPALVETLFGYSGGQLDGRDYRSLLDDLTILTHVLVGAEPLLPPRPVSRFPSFVDEPERELLANHPAITLHRLQVGGHAIAYHGAREVIAVLMSAARTIQARLEQPSTAICQRP